MDIVNKSAVAVLLTFLLSPGFAEVYRIVDKDGKVSFSDRSPTELQQHTSQSQSVEALEIELNARPDGDQAKSDGVKVSILRLLFTQSYLALNNRLTDYQNQMQTSISNEDHLIHAYQAFQMDKPGIEEHFNTWVTTFPASHHPYLARANYYFHQAAQIDLNAIKPNIDQQQSLMSKAEQDLDQAMHLDQTNLGNYRLLLTIAKLSHKQSEMKTIVNQALTFHPGSFRIRSDYLLFITPDQGGSYQSMQKLIDQALKQAHLNTGLKLLQAYIPYVQGRAESLRSGFQAAENLFIKALSYGENDIIWQARAINYYNQQSYRDAIKAFNRAISLNPENAAYYDWLCKSHAQLNQFDLAFTAIEYANALSPGNESIKETKNWLASKVKRQGYGLGAAGSAQ